MSMLKVTYTDKCKDMVTQQYEQLISHHNFDCNIISMLLDISDQIILFFVIYEYQNIKRRPFNLKGLYMVQQDDLQKEKIINQNQSESARNQLKSARNQLKSATTKKMI